MHWSRNSVGQSFASLGIARCGTTVRGTMHGTTQLTISESESRDSNGAHAEPQAARFLNICCSPRPSER